MGSVERDVILGVEVSRCDFEYKWKLEEVIDDWGYLTASCYRQCAILSRVSIAPRLEAAGIPQGDRSLPARQRPAALA